MKHLTPALWKHWFRYKYQGRGSIHCHETAKLKNDPGLCQLTETALKGFLAQNYKKENDYSDTTELDQHIEAGHRAASNMSNHSLFTIRNWISLEATAASKTRLGSNNTQEWTTNTS